MTKITEGYVETASDSLTEGKKHCNVIQSRTSQHEDFRPSLGDEKQNEANHSKVSNGVFLCV